jgi:hypothetical protein
MSIDEGKKYSIKKLPFSKYNVKFLMTLMTKVATSYYGKPFFCTTINFQSITDKLNLCGGYNLLISHRGPDMTCFIVT